MADLPGEDPVASGETPAPESLPTRGPSLSRAAAVMSTGTALSRLTGFVRIAVTAWAIGGAESKLPDTYALANSMPNMVYQLVIGEVLATLFVPVFIEHIRTKAREEASALASSILSVATAVATAFTALTIVLAPWIIKIYTINVDDPATRAAQEEVGAFFLRLLMPQMIFYALTAVFTGLLNAHRRFGAPMFAPILNNLIVIATFLAFGMRNNGLVPELATISLADKVLLGGGTTLGIALSALALWPSVARLRGGYRFGSLALRHPAVRRVGRLARYSFGYVIVNQIGLWIVFALANGERGGVAAYQAAWIIYQLPYGIFAVSVMTYLVPALAEHHVAGNTAAVREDVSLGLRTTALVMIPAAAGYVALGRPIIRLVLEHGVFSFGSTQLFADTFVLMSLGLPIYAAFQQVMRAFYAMQDTRTPLAVNVVAIGAQVASALVLFPLLGVPGLGLAHAISYATGLVAGASILRARLGGLDAVRLTSAHARIALAAVGMALGVWVVAREVAERVDIGLLPGQAAQVSAAIGTGLVLYLALAMLLRVQELRPLLAIVRKRGRRE
jgi:putative peptidoglycan lipid II flippase